jgi:glucose/arabinose dehydrogenase
MADDDGERPTLSRRDSLRTAGALGSGLLAGCAAGVGALDVPGTGQGSDELPAGSNESVAREPTEWSGYDPDWRVPSDRAPGEGYEVEVLVENLEIPWDMAFAPTGELFVTERTGRVLALDGGETRTVAEPDAVIDAKAVAPGTEEGSWVVEGGEGGLLGVAVHPAYPDPALVYTYFTTETEDGRTNRVVAFDAAAENAAAASWTVVDEIPADTFHNGGRIEFGPENYLWVATGDADPALETPERTRDPGSLAGKILRVLPDGDPAEDNPDIAPGADPRVYTYGHRNPQGLAWLPDGTAVITEHGPGGGDEVNVLRAGADYGWPTARNGEGFTDYAETDFQAPVADAVSWAPSGAVFYTGDAVPALRNRLLFGGLISQQVVAVTLSAGAPLSGDYDRHHDADWLDDDYRAAHDTLLEDRLGRVRHVAQGPEGDLYALTSNRDGRASGDFPTERDDVLVRITRA